MCRLAESCPRRSPACQGEMSRDACHNAVMLEGSGSTEERVCKIRSCFSVRRLSSDCVAFACLFT